MELGSDFELDITSLKETEDTIFRYLDGYHSIYTDSGRSAGRLLNHKLSQGTVLLPAYICESVVDVYREGYQIVYYQVKDDLRIDMDDLEGKLSENVCLVYLMHYFGQLQPEDVLQRLSDLRTKYGFVIIEDTTHSIFTKRHTIGDYCLCSLRKWFPIPDGAVLYSEAELDLEKGRLLSRKAPSRRLEAMVLKHAYIHDGVDGHSLYRQIFMGEEEKLDGQKEQYQISYVSEALLRGLPVEEMAVQRRHNCNRLRSFLGQLGIQCLVSGKETVPLTCPIYMPNRDAFRSYLSDSQIYCAVHWPLPKEQDNEAARWISSHIISLPIDQRYGDLHMEYLEHIIKGGSKLWMA